MRHADHAGIPIHGPGARMQHDLREFLSRFLGTVAMTLVPVVLIAFMSMPLSLGRHPGEAAPSLGAPIAHMT
jgi:hypothetical protein